MTLFNCNLPELLNKERSKKHIKFYQNDNFFNNRNEIIEYIDNFQHFNLFSLKRVQPYNHELIKTQLRFKNNITSFNYMDEYVRELCCLIAHDLRDQIGKNIFFDLKNGYFYFFI